MALALPYPDMDFVPLDILTAAEQDQLVANIEYIANQFPIGSSNIANGAISTAKQDNSVNAINNYSTSEVETGYTWVDGKKIHKKTIKINALPDSTGLTYAHGITNMDTVVNFEAVYTDGTSTYKDNVPPVAVSSLGWIRTSVDRTVISINSGVNRSSWSGWVTIYYTKTS